MKYLILFLLLLPLSLIGQVESQFNGTLNVFSGSRIGSTNTFTISGIFNSTTTSYTSSQSDTGDIVQVQSGSRFYWLHIYSIASNAGGVITCNVRDSSSTLTTFPLGKWSIFRPTTNLRLPLSPDGETNASRSSTFNTLALRVDEIQTAVASSTNCEQTFTKASHGFRKGTPVFWNGSTYIRPTADSLVPDFVVVDSLTANTFKVANCGTYTTSLANGLYWFTSASPGYSLTQDTTKVPLFQALNGKLILNPIVGFNLMSQDADGNGIISELPLNNVSINATNHSLSLLNLTSLNIESSGITPGSIVLSNTYESKTQYYNQAKTKYFKLYKTVDTRPGTVSSFPNFVDVYEVNFSGGSSGFEWGNYVAYDTTNNVFIYKFGGKHGNSMMSFYAKRPSSGSSYLNSPRFPFYGTNSAENENANTYHTKWGSSETDMLMGLKDGGKFLVGADSSFIHDPVQDTTRFKGRVRAEHLIIRDTIIRTDYSAPYRFLYSKSAFRLGNRGDNITGIDFYSNKYFTELSNFAINDLNGVELQVSAGGGGSALLRLYPNGDFVFGTLRYQSNNLSLTPAGEVRIHNLYNLPKASPNATAGAISTPIWTAGTPSFLRSQHNVATGTTDGSGDLTVTFAAVMPDITYTMIATVEGTTSYTTSVHTKATGTCKVRFFNPTTGTAVTATSVTISYEAKDY